MGVGGAAAVGGVGVGVGRGVGRLQGVGGSVGVDCVDCGGSGAALATGGRYDRAAEAFRHLGPFAGRRGVRIVFEIHMNMLHDTVASTVKLLDKIGCDNVMANPDPGNMFSTSTAEHEAGALERLRGRIGYFHFKNCCLHAGQYNYLSLIHISEPTRPY